jgi:hypothetical protein
LLLAEELLVLAAKAGVVHQYGSSSGGQMRCNTQQQVDFMLSVQGMLHAERVDFVK